MTRPTPARAPKKVWLVLNPHQHPAVAFTEADARDLMTFDGDTITGPYVLAPAKPKPKKRGGRK